MVRDFFFCLAPFPGRLTFFSWQISQAREGRGFREVSSISWDVGDGACQQQSPAIVYLEW